MRSATVLAPVVFLMCVVSPALAQTPPQAPFLRIEAGSHIGAVPHVAVDASGRLLATAGYDKTVRLWSLPDGRPQRLSNRNLRLSAKAPLSQCGPTPSSARDLRVALLRSAP